MPVDFNHWCAMSEVRYMAMKMQRKQWLKKATPIAREELRKEVHDGLLEVLDLALEESQSGSESSLTRSEALGIVQESEEK